MARGDASPGTAPTTREAAAEATEGSGLVIVLLIVALLLTAAAAYGFAHALARGAWSGVVIFLIAFAFASLLVIAITREVIAP